MRKRLTIDGSVQVSDDLYLKESGEYVKVDEYIRKHHLVYSPPKRISGQQGYLYEMSYSGYSYADALLWDFERPNEPLSGGCSTFRNGNLVGRNFDWYFDNNVEFLVKSSNAGCHDVIGVSTGMAITKEDMEKRRDLGDLYRIIPFYLVDGINDAGLVVSEHVVPHNPDFYSADDKNTHNYGENATSESEQIPSLFLPRFILDHCKDLDEVVDYLGDKIITQAKFVIENGYEVHYMIMGDTPCTRTGYEGAKSLILEFRNSRVVLLPCVPKENGEWTVYPVLTNFHISCPESDSSGRNQITLGPLLTPKGHKRLSTPADAAGGHFASVENGIELMGQGLERYNVLIDKALDDGISTEYATMLSMTGVWYDKAYEGTNSTLDTEFADGTTLTVDAPTSEYDDIKGRAKNAWNTAVRKEHSPVQPWQTTHTSVYNIPERKIYIKAQNGAYQDNISETPLIAVRSLQTIENKYISPFFYDLEKTGASVCTCNFNAQHGEVYELCAGEYNFTDFKLENDKECKIMFSLGSGAADVRTITFPASWKWLNETEFTSGNTYCICLTQENGNCLASVKHKYQTN